MDQIRDALDLLGYSKRAGAKNVDEYLKQPGQLAVQRPPQTVAMARLIQKNTNVPALTAAYSGGSN